MHKVSAVECKTYDEKEVRKAVEKAIEDIGFKIKMGSKVLLKPNVLMGAKPEKAITTNPAIIDAVCTILEKHKCEILIGESSGVVKEGGVLEAFEECGIAEAAKKHNAKLVSFGHEKIIKVENEKAVFAKTMYLPKIFFDVDLIINLPKMKTHALMLFTGAVKNLFGCIPGGRKQEYHAEANTKEKFANLLLDIWQNVKPQLSIMDGIEGMDGNGPSNGNVVSPNLILASDNAIALDIVAEKIVGFEGEVLTNRFAVKRGLINKEEIKHGELPSFKFRKPSTAASAMPSWLSGYFLKKGKAYPVIDKKKCRNCKTCVNVCPVQAMKMEGYPECDKKKCITCYCCQEMCPYDAIQLKRSFLFSAAMGFYYRIMDLMKKK
ncbi:MAG: DUF362 domain-containing protein [Candidatus Nanoarchaeia archaeon]|nr:DUF362 domain-containing protein [Candidatus Nanoarchaeia archaeon]